MGASPGTFAMLHFLPIPFLLISARVVGASATETGGSSLIAGRVKPTTIKTGIHSFPA